MANRVHENICARYCHFIFARWEDISYSGYMPDMDVELIKKNMSPLGRTRWPGVIDYDKNCKEIETLAIQKLDELNKTADQKRLLEQQEKEAKQKATNIAYRQRQYEELKKEFEPNE